MWRNGRAKITPFRSCKDYEECDLESNGAMLTYARRGKSERGIIIMYIAEMQDHSYYVNSYIGDLIYYLLIFVV
jgi:hypothetical protein